ncbi:hypothetical protein HPQ64_17300 [Rhizobiales bacterium]|uniref:hypothetical protein n=1 Tax=Hongsoonwoonella zoysiae TaxID=2821844 RepID=UPI001560758E|nr:hypothetical protein [Hongsoonwoonella zoysiae]NRG19452.1 hypothetical protein [Hongsoonwoonella zoysiae]
MISIEDCIAMSGLDEAEILALAEHEHIPEVVAAALGTYLLHRKKGPEKIRQMIEDDIRDALARGEKAHAKDLLAVLRHFMKEHKDELSGKTSA